MKSKKIKWELLVFICIIAFVLLCVCFGKLSYTPGDKFFAVSPFGKLELLGVDQAVITVDGESVIVTDAELLGRIVDETTVATVADICDGCCLKDRTIDLYRGDKLVRSMKWIDGHDNVLVYEADLTHWMFPPTAKAGHVILSKELVSALEALF